MKGTIQSMFKDIFGNDVFNKTKDVLMLEPSSDFSVAWEVIGSIYETVMVPIAIGLMVIWFCIAFMEKCTSEQVTHEQLFMLFVKLIAAFYLISHGFEIFELLWRLGNSLVSSVGEAFSAESLKKAIGAAKEASEFDQEAIEAIYCKFAKVKKWDSNIGVIKGIGLLCQLLVPWLVSKAMIAIVYFICYSRLLEMLIRILGAPVALSDFFKNGLQGAGWRYLISFLAIALQGMLIVAICNIYPLIMAGVISTSGNAWTVILKYLAFSFSAIALMFKSLSLAKELVGAS